jgi:RNA polymerase sigma factor (sigma-70 family)
MFDGNIFKQLIEETGMSYKRFSKTVGLNYTQVLDYCNGRGTPELSVVVELADYFAVPIDLLVGKCTAEQADNILSNYSQTFMLLRRASFEKYLAGRRNLPKIVLSPQYEEPYPYNLIHDIMNEPSDRVITNDKIRVLEELLKQLPENSRQCIDLYYKKGRTLESIAKEHNLSKERIRQIISRGLCQIKTPVNISLIINGWENTKKFERRMKQLTKELEAKEKDLSEREKLVEAGENHLKKWIDIFEFDSTGAFNPKKKNCEQLLSKSVSSLGLSARALHVLYKNGYKTVFDVVKQLNTNASKLIRLHNMGKISYREILCTLDELLGSDFQTKYKYELIRE